MVSVHPLEREDDEIRGLKSISRVSFQDTHGAYDGLHITAKKTKELHL